MGRLYRLQKLQLLENNSIITISFLSIVIMQLLQYNVGVISFIEFCKAERFA